MYGHSGIQHTRNAFIIYYCYLNCTEHSWDCRILSLTYTQLFLHKFTCNFYIYINIPRTVSSLGAVWESGWLSWAVCPSESSGFCEHKAILNHASALATACP